AFAHIRWVLRHHDAVAFIEVKHSKSFFGGKGRNKKADSQVGLFRTDTFFCLISSHPNKPSRGSLVVCDSRLAV
ncbi:MAG: hypothetical protein IKR25_09190, partial [Muribaculaceae bacterium]|nr:hypothetical protein [Muribaculaceae bacterium]